MDVFRIYISSFYYFFAEFDPEPSPKWKCLSDLLVEEIPEEVKKKKDGGLHNTKILILCQDNKTCSQLNHFLTMGPNKYLFYTAFRRDLTINTISSKFKKYKNTIPKETENKKTKGEKIDQENKELDGGEEELSSEDSNKSNYILTLTQVTQTKQEPEESMFEPISQVSICN